MKKTVTPWGVAVFYHFVRVWARGSTSEKQAALPYDLLPVGQRGQQGDGHDGVVNRRGLKAVTRGAKDKDKARAATTNTSTFAWFEPQGRAAVYSRA